VVERVPEEMHIAALPGSAGQDLADRLLEVLVIVRDDKLDAEQAALLQLQQKVRPS